MLFLSPAQMQTGELYQKTVRLTQIFLILEAIFYIVVVPGGVGAAENGSKTETTNGVETSEPSLSNGEESEESNGSNPDTENSSESASNMSQEVRRLFNDYNSQTFVYCLSNYRGNITYIKENI